MNNIINRIYIKLGINNARTKNVSSHVVWSFLYKGGSLIATFLLVPLTISYLDTENYGVWLTLSSFIAWFSFFDIGLGNGLRNKFAEAITENKTDLARGYVSTAYFTIGAICGVFLILSLIVGQFVDWTAVFNTSARLQNDLRLLMPVVFGCFSLQLIVKLIASIYVADQNHSFSGKTNFMVSMASLLVVWLLTMTSKSSLLLFGTLFSILPVLIFLIFNMYAFNGKYRQYRPKLVYSKKEHFNDIFGLGFHFFIIQISVVVLNATDNFIIAQLFGSKEVVPYNIAYKYLGISLMLCTMVFTPFWSSITQAYVKGELGWIKKAIKNLQRFSWLVIVLLGVLIWASPIAYRLLSNNQVTVPQKLTLWISTYFVVMVLFVPYTFFLNGIGKIKIQMYLSAFAALINIPLSIFLVRYFGMGTEGVIIATIIGVFPNLILYPIQYKKLINKRAAGVWNK